MVVCVEVQPDGRTTTEASKGEAMKIYRVVPGGDDWRDVIDRCVDWREEAIDIRPLLEALRIRDAWDDATDAKVESRWGTVEDAAQQLQMSTKTVRRMISRGEISAHRVGPRLMRVDMSSLEDVGTALGVGS